MRDSDQTPTKQLLEMLAGCIEQAGRGGAYAMVPVEVVQQVIDLIEEEQLVVGAPAGVEEPEPPAGIHHEHYHFHLQPNHHVERAGEVLSIIPSPAIPPPHAVPT